MSLGRETISINDCCVLFKPEDSWLWIPWLKVEVDDIKMYVKNGDLLVV